MGMSFKRPTIFSFLAAGAVLAAAIHFTAAGGACQGVAEKASPKEVVLPESFKNAENLKFAIKKLKSMFVTYSVGYNENDGQLKTLITDIVSCVGDCDVSAMEAAGLSESLAETIFRLKVMPDGQKRIYDQFVRVLDEAGIKRSLSNDIADDARGVYEIISQGKESQGAPNNLIYKYYGVNGKGHAAHKTEKEKNFIRGKDSFFGAGKAETAEMIKKYSDDKAGKKKKIVGMEFMDPVAARETHAPGGDAKGAEKKDAADIIKEKTGPGAGDEKKDQAAGAGKKTE